MEPRTSEVFPNLTGPQEREDATEKLRQESSQLLGVHLHKRTTGDGVNGSARSTAGSAPRIPSKESPGGEDFSPIKGLKGDYYKVTGGDNLTSIAQRMLKLRGDKTSAREVYDEVNRIVELNIEKFPWLAKNPNKIRPGMVLQVWDKETGPNPTCLWKDWKEAEPGRITVALKCESIFAGKGTQVIATPGSRAVFTPGSFGFVAPNAYARALSNSHVIAVGGEVVDDGGDLQIMHSEVRVRTEGRLRAAEKANLEPKETRVIPAIARTNRDTGTEETIEVPPIH